MNQWSLSRLQRFEECPYRVKLQYIDKVEDTQPHKSAERGSKIHEEAERFVKGLETFFPKSLKHFYPDFTALRLHYDAGNVSCEEEWGFDREWQEAPWDTAWLRVKCDCVLRFSENEMLIVDYKTGQKYGNEVKHQQQLQLYAVAGLMKYPQVETVVCELWYLDKNELTRFLLERNELDKYKEYFTQAGERICAETEFAPNPNLHSCRFCPYAPNRQADCEFGVAVEKGNIVTPVKIDVPKDWEPPKEYANDVAAFLDSFGK